MRPATGPATRAGSTGISECASARTPNAAEELIAELGAAFLCADLQVTPSPRDDHAAYIDHWLKIMKGDKKAIFTAAAKANQALEYLQKKQQVAKAA